MKYDNFFDAFHFLDEHPAFVDRFQHGCLKTYVVKVNPETEAIDDNESLNTAVRVWLECGKYEAPHTTHDISLDCGAPTYEEAIIELAQLVLKEYGDYEIPEPTDEEMVEINKFFDRIKSNS